MIWPAQRRQQIAWELILNEGKITTESEYLTKAPQTRHPSEAIHVSLLIVDPVSPLFMPPNASKSVLIRNID